MAKDPTFKFSGGAASYLGTGILAFLITVFSAGLCYPFARVLLERWKAKYATIDGRKVIFKGTGWGLFGLWIKWFVLSVVTFGIYTLWVGPQIQKWKWENLEFAD